MVQSYYTGISGLQNSSIGIDMVANNIANISTTGYRAYKTEFASIFEDALSSARVGNSNSRGIGVRVQTAAMTQAQGALALSDRSSDVAIEGDGWFGVQSDGDIEYTRDGTFAFDVNSDLVTTDGFYVLGTKGSNISKDNVLTKKNAEIKLSSIKEQEKLSFPTTLTYPPEPSTKAKFMANLGVGYDPITVGTTVIDPQNNKNYLQLKFVKNPTQTSLEAQYSVTATTQSLDGSTIYDTKTGSASFDVSGALISTSLNTIDNNGASVSIDLGNGYNGITAIDIPVVSGSGTADGIVGGDLVGYSVNGNAEVIATFTNGIQSSVGKIAVYHFTNEQGLKRINGTRFQQSVNSGEAQFWKDADGKPINGSNVFNFRLESSNVSLSFGLTELIIMQCAYNANSKSITTSDQMIQKAIKM